MILAVFQVDDIYVGDVLGSSRAREEIFPGYSDVLMVHTMIQSCLSFSDDSVSWLKVVLSSGGCNVTVLSPM